MRTVLITGAQGFAGSNFTHWMMSRGARHGFRAVLHAKSGGHGASFESGNLTDKDNVAAILTKHSPDVIVHYAGRVPLASRQVTDSEFMHSNTETTRALVDVASSLKQKPHIILPSTAAIYPLAETVCNFKTAARNVIYARTDDAIPLGALETSYARSKALSEEILQTYEGNWTILRKPTVIGPDDRRGNFLQLAALYILDEKDLPLSNLQRCSDYIGTRDIFEAVIASALSPNAYHRVMNVGSGQATTGYEAWRAMLKAASAARRDTSFAAPLELPATPEKFPGKVLDILDTKRLIGYEPQTSLDQLCGIIWSDVLSRNSPRQHLRDIFPNF
jgi:nucleoside-diphosphate-sugar epimerase